MIEACTLHEALVLHASQQVQSTCGIMKCRFVLMHPSDNGYMRVTNPPGQASLTSGVQGRSSPDLPYSSRHRSRRRELLLSEQLQRLSDLLTLQQRLWACLVCVSWWF